MLNEMLLFSEDKFGTFCNQILSYVEGEVEVYYS